MWDALRLWAYVQDRPENRSAWVEEVYRKASALNRGHRDGQLSDDTVQDMATRVAEWVLERWESGEWDRFAAGTLGQLDSEIQALRQVLQAETRRAKNAVRDAQIRGLANTGDSVRTIANKMNMPRSTVHDVLKRPPRSPPPPPNSSASSSVHHQI